jgi:hypothetical protein
VKPPCNVKPGDRYGYLVVLEVLGGRAVDRDSTCGRRARVRCDCGKRKMVRARHLRTIKSCGCKRGELISQAKLRFYARQRQALMAGYLFLSMLVFTIASILFSARHPRPRKPRLEILSEHCADAAFRDRAREDARRRA